MCKLSETSERWTSLSTSHDERIMTVIAKQSKGKVHSNGKCNAKFCELAGSKAGDNSQSECAMMTESADACFSGPRLCLYIQFFEFCESFLDSPRESCIKGANHVRGGVLKSTLIVDNEQHAFSPTVLTICSQSSTDARSATAQEQRFMAYCDTVITFDQFETQSYSIIFRIACFC